MKKQVKFYFIICLYIIGGLQTSFAQTIKVKETVDNAFLLGDPSHIKIMDHIGKKIDDCIEHQVMSVDPNYLVTPFYNKTETHRWQSEFWGKWMLSAILSYQYTQDAVLLDSMKSAVKGLIGSQLPDGYIGNYAPEAQLQQWDVWGRKYSMLGLLAYYDLTNDKKALKAAQGIADHLMTQVINGKTDISTTGNYRGMASSSVLEPIVFLYKRTGDKRYLDFAQYIVSDWETDHGPKLLSKAEGNVNVADRFPHPVKRLQKSWFSSENGQKAYEMMSCYEGLLELYKITSNARYLDIVEKTVKNIIDTEINIAGSGSAFECWYHGKSHQTRPTYHTMETCVTMTWMKLCQTLLALTGNPLYADQIERTAYNAMLASMKDDATTIAKYSPLEGQRHPGEDQCDMHINCCIANGPRAFGILPQFAVMKTANDGIVINLYSGLVSEIELDNKNTIRINQRTNYPIDGRIEIEVNINNSKAFTLNLRIPQWSADNTLIVNDESLDGLQAGTYYPINRTWHNGDKIVLNLDVRGRIVNQDNCFAIEKGPVVLARDNRFNDSYVDETARVVSQNGYVELTPVQSPLKDMWMVFTAPLVLGTDLEGDGRNAKQIHFCDFSSAGNTWEKQVRYRVWIPETFNVMNTEYTPY